MKPSVNFAIVIQLLLLAEAADAKPNLHELVQAGDKQAVSAALPSRKIDKLDKKGNAPIHYAAAAANAGITELLLVHGADPSVSNKRYETTPLHEVARSNARSARSIRETLTALLRYGADLWVTDTHGETPLMAASRAGNAVVVNASCRMRPLATRYWRMRCRLLVNTAAIQSFGCWSRGAFSPPPV